MGSKTNPIEDEAADWMLRAQLGMDADERVRWQAWLERDPAHRAAYDRLAIAWSALDQLAEDPAMLAMREQARRPVAANDDRPPRRWRGLAAAASLLLMAGGGWWWTQSAPEPLVFSTGHGAMRNIALADGSQLMLDAESRISVTMTPRRRLIRLDRGQAYFKVAHDAARPFVVTAETRAVVALGTEFDVKARDGLITVALTQGRVRVGDARTDTAALRPDGGAAGTELSVGQTLSYDNRTGITRLTANSAEAAADWRAGRLHFDHTPLSSVVSDINRYAPTPIRLSDPALGAWPVSGVFRADNAQGLLDALPLLFPLRVERRADVILIRRAE